MLFESITKQLREAQNDQSEGTILTLSWLLQWLSRSAQKNYYRTADFWVQVAQGPIHSRKQMVWRTQCAKHGGEQDFEPKTSRTRSGLGGTHRILENVVFEHREFCPPPAERTNRLPFRAPGPRCREFPHKLPQIKTQWKCQFLRPTLEHANLVVQSYYMYK